MCSCQGIFVYYAVEEVADDFHARYSVVGSDIAIFGHVRLCKARFDAITRWKPMALNQMLQRCREAANAIVGDT